MEVLRGTWGWSHVPWPSGFVPWSSSEEKANFHSAKWESGSQTCNLKCLHFRVKAVRSRPVRRLLPDVAEKGFAIVAFYKNYCTRGAGSSPLMQFWPKQLSWKASKSKGAS